MFLPQSLLDCPTRPDFGPAAASSDRGVAPARDSRQSANPPDPLRTPRRHSAVQYPDRQAGRIHASSSFAPDRDWLVGHDLRLHSQAICRRCIDRNAKIRCVAAIRCHLANHHRCMSSRKGIRLHDHGRPRFTIVARRRNRNHIAALHSRSNSDTASIHPNAASSRARSKPATSLAIRRRIVFDRASGTTRRNSRKPLACRRSRIALIRSAAAIVFPQDRNA